MLENEPDTTIDRDTRTDPETTIDTGAQTPPTTTPPRRRRAASRPAGPPAVEPASTAKAAKRAPAKRAPRKTTAKQAAAADEQPASDAAAGVAPAPRTRAPRKRAAAKSTNAPPAKTVMDPAVAADLLTPVETPAVDPDAVEEPILEPASTPAEANDMAVTVDESPTERSINDQTAADDELTARTKQLWADPFSVPTATDSTPAARASSPGPESDQVSDPVSDEQTSDEPTSDDESSAGDTFDDQSSDDQSPDDQSPGEQTSSDESSSDDSSSDSDGDGVSRRRRRRRGGRRHRRSGSDEEPSNAEDVSEPSDSARRGRGSTGSDASDSETDAVPPSGEPAEEDGSHADEEDSSGQGRRRRRRRRRGEDSGAAADDPSEVVVRVREPRARKKAAAETEVTGITGSTRMEAKRQRRREGREAGRRRVPILSEAEFLTRRESVKRTMVIRQREDLSQIAVTEDDILVEHYVDRDSATSLIGNVYLGRVQNVLPSMEAAFVDIGRGRNAVLYAGEVDWDSFGADGHHRKVEKVLKSGQTILVQVSKDPVGAKGARLTNHVSIPGRYIVYSPGGHLSGISRKLPDNERRRLKDILHDLVGESASVIVRTAAEGASEEELVRDVNRLKAQWADIESKIKAGNAPQLLYGEPDLTVRIVRDLFTEDFSDLLIQGNGLSNDAHEAIQGYVSHVAPHLADRMHAWNADDNGDIFTAHRLDEQIAKALERKVFLPSGGSLVIDRTEAMTVIDVNTGKFTGTGGNLEATVTSNNLEAAEEIVRQLRLRDIGGIIVIDFIDMVLPNNRELLIRRLVECLGRDRTRHQVAEVTSLGLVQMTRKKIGTGLLEAFSTECEHCHGRGVMLHQMPVETQKQADGGARAQRPGDRRGGRQGRNDGSRPESGRTDGGRPESGRTDGGRARGGRGGRDQGDFSDQVNESSHPSSDRPSDQAESPDTETPAVDSQQVDSAAVEAQHPESAPAESQQVESAPVEPQQGAGHDTAQAQHEQQQQAPASEALDGNNAESAPTEQERPARSTGRRGRGAARREQGAPTPH